MEVTRLRGVLKREEKGAEGARYVMRTGSLGETEVTGHQRGEKTKALDKNIIRKVAETKGGGGGGCWGFLGWEGGENSYSLFQTEEDCEEKRTFRKNRIWRKSGEMAWGVHCMV